MQIGNIVKWMVRGDSYGELGLVVDVYSNGNYQVYWMKDSDYANHYKDTGHIEIVDTNFA